MIWLFGYKSVWRHNDWLIDTKQRDREASKHVRHTPIENWTDSKAFVKLSDCSVRVSCNAGAFFWKLSAQKSRVLVWITSVTRGRETRSYNEWIGKRCVFWAGQVTMPLHSRWTLRSKTAALVWVRSRVRVALALNKMVSDILICKANLLNTITTTPKYKPDQNPQKANRAEISTNKSINWQISNKNVIIFPQYLMKWDIFSRWGISHFGLSYSVSRIYAIRWNRRKHNCKKFKMPSMLLPSRRGIWPWIVWRLKWSLLRQLASF